MISFRALLVHFRLTNRGTHAQRFVYVSFKVLTAISYNRMVYYQSECSIVQHYND